MACKAVGFQDRVDILPVTDRLIGSAADKQDDVDAA
jgi:hypothetical protein